MTKKKIYLYGAITTIAPIVTIISCGSNDLSPEQKKMNGITMDMVKAAINITPSNAKFPTEVSEPNMKASKKINGVEHVVVKISTWNQMDANGKINAIVAISRPAMNLPSPGLKWPGLTPPDASPFNITWEGFKIKTN